MKFFSRAICYFLAILFALQGFLVSPVQVKAVGEAPTPNPDGCYLKNTGGETKIECTFSSKTVAFTHNGDYRYNQGAHLTRNWQFWSAPRIGSQTYYLLVEPTGATTGLKIDRVGTLHDQEVCQSSANSANCLIVKVLTNGNTAGVNAYMIHSKVNGWNAFTSLSPSGDTTVLKSVADRTTTATLPVVDLAHRVPSSATINGCSASLQPRITANGGAQKIVNDLKDGFLKQINESEQDPGSKQAAIDGLNRIFANADSFIQESEDIELYKNLYSSVDPAPYPDVEITTNVYNIYRDLVSDLAPLEGMIGFNPADHWGSVLTFFKGSAVVAGGTGVVLTGGAAVTGAGLAGALAAGSVVLPVLVASGGVIVGGTIGNYITIWQNKAEYSDLLKRELKIMLAYTYLKKNLEYNKCAKDKGDAGFARYDENMERSIDALFTSTTTIGANLNTSTEGDTVCDGIKGGIMAMLGQAICGMVLILKGWADGAYLWSVKLLAASIGVATDDNFGVTVPEGETGVEGTGASGGSSATGGSATGSTNFWDANGATAEQIDSYIAKTQPNSPLKGKGQAFVDAAKGYVVNPAFMVGIANAETSLGMQCIDGSSPAAPRGVGNSKNGFGMTDGNGQGHFLTYQSYEAGINDATQNFGSSTYNKLKDIKEIRLKWCGYENGETSPITLSDGTKVDYSCDNSGSNWEQEVTSTMNAVTGGSASTGSTP